MVVVTTTESTRCGQGAATTAEELKLSVELALSAELELGAELLDGALELETGCTAELETGCTAELETGCTAELERACAAEESFPASYLSMTSCKESLDA